jgi:hypothetical protein
MPLWPGLSSRGFGVRILWHVHAQRPAQQQTLVNTRYGVDGSRLQFDPQARGSRQPWACHLSFESDSARTAHAPLLRLLVGRILLILANGEIAAMWVDVQRLAQGSPILRGRFEIIAVTALVKMTIATSRPHSS